MNPEITYVGKLEGRPVYAKPGEQTLFVRTDDGTYLESGRASDIRARGWSVKKWEIPPETNSNEDPRLTAECEAELRIEWERSRRSHS